MYYIVKFVENKYSNRAYLYGSFETEEEANKSMLDVYNVLYTGERKKAINWGVAMLQSREEVYGADKTYDNKREVTYEGLLRYEVVHENDISMIEADYKTRLV